MARTRERYFLMRPVYALGKLIAKPFKKIYKYLKSKLPQRTRIPETDRQTNLASAHAKGRHKFTAALGTMVATALQRKVNSIESLGDGILTALIKPALGIIVGRKIDVDTIAQNIEISLINDVTNDVDTLMLPPKITAAYQLWDDETPSIPIRIHILVLLIANLESYMPTLEKILTKESPKLELKDKPKTLAVNTAIERYMLAVKKILLDEMQNIILGGTRSLQLDFKSAGFLGEISDAGLGLIKTYSEQVAELLNNNRTFIIPECDHITINLQPDPQYTWGVAPIFITKERIRRRLRDFDNSPQQIKKLIPDARSAIIIEELRDLADANTFMRILKAANPNNRPTVNQQSVLDFNLILVPDETVMNAAADYYVYRLLNMRAYYEADHDSTHHKINLKKRHSVVKKVLDFAEDGAGLVVDLLDDVSELTGVNAAIRLTSIKSWLEPRLIRSIPAERIPALLAELDADEYIAYLLKLPQKHLRAILCAAIPEFNIVTTSETSKNVLIQFQREDNYLQAVLCRRGKYAAETALWALVEIIDPKRLVSIAAKRSEQLHLRYLNEFARFPSLWLQHTVTTHNLMTTPTFFTRTLPKKIVHLCKNKPACVDPTNLNELQFIAKLATESLNFNPALQELGIDINFVIYYLLEQWLVHINNSYPRSYFMDNGVKTWLEKFHEYKDLLEKYLGPENFTNKLANTSAANVNAALSALIHNFPRNLTKDLIWSETGDKISTELLYIIIDRISAEQQQQLQVEIILARQLLGRVPYLPTAEDLAYDAYTNKLNEPGVPDYIRIMPPPIAYIQNICLFFAQKILADDCSASNKILFAAAIKILIKTIADQEIVFTTDEQAVFDKIFALLVKFSDLELTSNWINAQPATQLCLAWQQCAADDKIRLHYWLDTLNGLVANKLIKLLRPIFKMQVNNQKEIRKLAEFHQKIADIKLGLQQNYLNLNTNKPTTGFFAYFKTMNNEINNNMSSATIETKYLKPWREFVGKTLDVMLQHPTYIEANREYKYKFISMLLLHRLADLGTQLAELDADHDVCEGIYLHYEKLFDSCIIWLVNYEEEAEVRPEEQLVEQAEITLPDHQPGQDNTKGITPAPRPF